MRIDSPAKIKIMNGFMALMEEQPLSTIKVIDIIKESGVSHQTFYRTFLDKYDLAKKVCVSKMDIVYSVVGKNPTWRDAAVCTLNVIANDGTFFANLLSEKDGIVIMKEAIEAVADDHIGVRASEMASNAWLHNLVVWSRGGFVETPEVVCDMILKSLPVGEVVGGEEMVPYLEAYSKLRIGDYKERSGNGESKV